MTKDIKTFGAYLRSLRESSKMTLKDVAEKISIDPSLLAKIERSERQPTKEFINSVAAVFNIDPKALQSEFLSDLIAYKILNEDADINILKVAESKVLYLKNIQK